MRTGFGMELWEERKQRIKKISKFGSSPDWDLISVSKKTSVSFTHISFLLATAFMLQNSHI